MLSVPVALLVGHLVGDYLLQPRVMAENKGEKGGLWWSLLHGAIYTVCVCALLRDFSTTAVAAVFVSHWPLDRFGVASLWCRHVLDRHPVDVSKRGGDYSDVRVGFACLHYAVVDNGMHLVLMLLAWQLGLLG